MKVSLRNENTGLKRALAQDYTGREGGGRRRKTCIPLFRNPQGGLVWERGSSALWRRSRKRKVNKEG